MTKASKMVVVTEGDKKQANAILDILHQAFVDVSPSSTALQLLLQGLILSHAKQIAKERGVSDHEALDLLVDAVKFRMKLLEPRGEAS